MSAHISMLKQFLAFRPNELGFSRIHKFSKKAEDYSSLDSFKITESRNRLEEKVDNSGERALGLHNPLWF